MNTALYWVHKLFSTPRKGKLNPRDLPVFLQQADLDFFIYQGEKVYTYQWNKLENERPLILLIHGWESNSARWQELQVYFGDQYRCIALDAPSLGLSYGKNLSVKNYQEVIDLAIDTYKPKYVVGHSLGAFAFFQQLSEKSYPSIEKVVLLCTFDRFEVILSHYFALLGYSKNLRDAYLKYIEQLIQKPLNTYCSAYAIQFVSIPILCIHDQFDPQVSYQEATAFHQALQHKNNQLVSTANLGHSLQDKTVFSTIQAFFS